jgi:HEAT repeat protein
MAPPVVSDRFTLLIAGLLAISIPVGARPGKAKNAEQLACDLSAGSAELRRRAAADLSELGYEAIPAVPALSAALKDDDAAVRSAAALAISKIGPEAAAVPHLITLLKGRGRERRAAGLKALTRWGRRARHWPGR